MTAPTMSDLLIYNQRLRIDCHGNGCGHKACWTPQEAIERLGANTTFAQAKRKLTCPKCKDRKPEKMISVYPDMSDYYDWVDRQKYKREVERYGQEEADRWWKSRSYRLGQ